jgi:rubrerythrin
MSPGKTVSTAAKAKSAKGVAASKPRTAKPAAPIAKGRTAKRAAPANPRTAKPAAPAGKGRTAKRDVADKPGSAKGVAAARPRTAKPAAAPRTLEEFMTQALAMEVEAGQRYAEFADAMETHNNREVAALFRKMADIEGKHAKQIMAEMGWTTMPAPRPGTAFRTGFEAPETAPGDEVHYLMQPYHALELALANEQRAERFFGELARAATTASVRTAARELQAEEREHVELVRAWMKKVPKPDADWANDPDPPAYTD